MQILFEEFEDAHGKACESLHHCVLLVATFYTPYVHNLSFLRTQAERASNHLFEACPRDNAQARARFSKLRDAHVKARFSKHYTLHSHFGDGTEISSWLGGLSDPPIARALHAIHVNPARHATSWISALDQRRARWCR